jgi:hypothetical protein
MEMTVEIVFRPGQKDASRNVKKKHAVAVPIFAASLALLFTAAANAQYPSYIDWATQHQATGSFGYLPRLASDGITNDGPASNISVYQTATGFADLDYRTGGTPDLSHSDLFWSGPSTAIANPPEVGHAPGVAMAAVGYPITNMDVLIEVHQGGQDNGSELWYREGQGGVGSVEVNPAALSWGGAHMYDHGYNPTIASDQSSGAPLEKSTIVEVHQAQEGASDLWYHVGQLSAGTSTPSVSLMGAHFTGLQGYAPSVTVAGDLVILAVQGSTSQGTGGGLLYSIGQVQLDISTGEPTGEISWSHLIHYDDGYNPSVSLATWYESGANWVVVESHQADTGTGPLQYRIGVLNPGGNGSNPTEIQWHKNPNNGLYSTEYDESGCYPAVAQTYFNGLWSLVETNSTECGKGSTIVSSYGPID